MPVEKLAGIQSSGSGVGIRRMHERIRQLRGEMKMGSDGSGTTVSVTLPIAVDPTPKRELVHAPEFLPVLARPLKF